MSQRPYPGLRSFRREEVDIFFGRDLQTDQILDKLYESHFLAVVGPSGCGKSSLVRTGALAGLDSGFMPNIGARWIVADLHPGYQPFLHLAKALLKDSLFAQAYRLQFPPEWGEDWQQRALPFLQASLQRGPMDIHQLLDSLALDQDIALLLLVDQFEELFRYRHYNSNEVGAFVRLLLTASSHPAVYTIITMRSDFLGHCSRFQGLPEAINRGLYLTPRLDRDQLADAIQLPAAVFEGEIEPALVARLLNDAGQTADQLPLLQHLLMRLWELNQEGERVLSLQAYLELGGLENILNQHLEETWDSLSETQQHQTEQIFKLLTERTREGQDIRSPIQIKDLMQATGLSFEEISRLVDIFRCSGRHFLMPPTHTRLALDSVIDITHESLIRQWQRLQAWVDDEAETAELYRRLADTASRYQQGKAALLVTPELELAINWRDKQKPTARWAARYGNDFETVMTFLQESEQERERLIKHAEEERIEKVRLRYRRPLIGFAIGFAFFLVSSIVGWSLYMQLNNTLRELGDTQSQVYTSLFRQAAILAQADDFEAANERLLEMQQWNKQSSPEQKQQAYLLEHYINQRQLKPSASYADAGFPLHDIKLLPDGRHFIAVGENGLVAVYQVDNPQAAPVILAGQASYARHLQSIAVHPNGEYMVTAGDDGLLSVWRLNTDLTQSQVVQRLSVPGLVKAVAFSEDGAYLASGGTDQRVSLWQFNARAGEPLVTEALWRQRHGGQISEGGLLFSPDGQYVVSASHAGTVRFWRLESGEEDQAKTLTHEGKALGLAFAPDGVRLAVAHDLRVSIWSWQTGVQLGALEGAHKMMIFSLAWVASEMAEPPRLVTASMDHALYLWDVENAVTLQKLDGHSAEVGVSGLAYNAQNRLLYSPGKDGVVLAWKSGVTRMHSIASSDESPQALAISTDKRWIVSGNYTSPRKGGALGSVLRVYNASLQQASEPLWLPNVRVSWMSFHPKQALLAVGVQRIGSMDASSAEVRLYELDSQGQLIAGSVWAGHIGLINDLAFSADGSYLYSASDDGQVGIFNLEQPTQPAVFRQLHDGMRIATLTVSTDGKYLISAHSGHERAIRFYALEQGLPASSFSEEIPLAQDPYRIRLSPDQRYLMVVGRRASALRFSLKDGLPDPREDEFALRRHTLLATHAEFIESANVLVSSDADAHLRFWDVEQGELLFAWRLPSHGGHPLPFRSFALQCEPNSCLLGVPLALQDKLIFYHWEWEKGK